MPPPSDDEVASMADELASPPLSDDAGAGAGTGEGSTASSSSPPPPGVGRPRGSSRDRASFDVFGVFPGDADGDPFEAEDDDEHARVLSAQQQFLDLNLGQLDITTEDIDLTEIDEDIHRFQQDDLVKEALAKGVNLRKYSKEIEQELRAVERQSIADYIAQSEHLAELHEQIKECDGVLEGLESILNGFQGDLGNISQDIKHLQDESLSMNVKLNNRRAAEGALSDFIDNVFVAPALVTKLCEADVNEAYVEYLTTLNHKIHFMREGDAADTLARMDVEPELDKLRVKAVTRVREFLLTKIHSLRKDKTNVQILQQNVLLKYVRFNAFLSEHSPEAAGEVRECYVDTMGRVYQKDFKQYLSNMTRLQAAGATKSDLIASDERELKGYFSQKVQIKGKSAVFSLAGRSQLLDRLDDPAIIYHVAEKNQTKLSFEEIWRSINHLLVITVSSEFLFLKDFLGSTEAFSNIFNRTLQLLLEHLHSHLATCYDAIGILTLIRITQHHLGVMRERNIDALDNHLQRVSAMLWPRFQHVLDLNVQSIRRADAHKLGNSKDVHAHYVTRRYAEMSASVQVLIPHASDNIANKMSMLRKHMNQFLARLAQEFKAKRSQLIFLINNYDLILNVYNERGIGHGGTETVIFEEMLAQYVDDFVEEALLQPFGNLVNFVVSSEPLFHTSSNPPGVTKQALERVVKDFAARWKQGIEAINADVLRNFPNFLTGMDILKKVFTQLLLYYTRFLDLRKKKYGGNAPSKDIVTIPTIMYEIKKFSRNF